MDEQRLQCCGFAASLNHYAPTVFHRRPVRISLPASPSSPPISELYSRQYVSQPLCCIATTCLRPLSENYAQKNIDYLPRLRAGPPCSRPHCWRAR
ncbi:hypothetical protein IG631_20044 [Alternaria alternata]|nr:hypothetical protein IG631_20044 [Alternaria alternata]